MKSTRSESLQANHIRLLRGSEDNQFPLIPRESIQVVERPEEGHESDQLFYNPRSIESMASEVMTKLRESIRRDGLHNPMMVRAFTEGSLPGTPIIRVELVAGERRWRSIDALCEENSLVYDWRSKEMRPAQDVYGHIPCEVFYNISDEEALRHAWTENDERENLSITDEIHLVERLTRRGLLQDEIAELLGTNVTWVSQTVNFRKELPAAAFQRLSIGKISRHVAVQILGYNKNDRDRLVSEAIHVEEEERATALNDIREEAENAEDQEDILNLRARQARVRGEEKAAAQVAKRAAAAGKRAAVARTKETRIEANGGMIRQGHLARGAVAADVAPRKAKVLTRGMIQQFFQELPSRWIEIGKVDPITKMAYPKEMLALMAAVAESILTGNPDPGNTIRRTLVSLGIWEMPAGVCEPVPEFLDIEDGDEELLEEIEAV